MAVSRTLENQLALKLKPTDSIAPEVTIIDKAVDETAK